MCDEHDATRVKLFCMGQAQDKLLRTSDAAQLLIRWAHYQSRVWNQANCSSPIHSLVTDMGWKRTDSHLVPHLLSLPPEHAPKSCHVVLPISQLNSIILREPFA